MEGTTIVETHSLTTKMAPESSPSTTRVVIVTTFELDEYVFDALAAAASAFLP